MKIRLGYISNSSSSSFIVGYGIVPKEKRYACVRFMQTNPKKLCNDYTIRKVHRLNDYNLLGELSIDTTDFHPNDHILTVKFRLGEGNHHFVVFDDVCDYSKAQRIDYFTGFERELIEKVFIEKLYFDKSKRSDYKFGAKMFTD